MPAPRPLKRSLTAAELSNHESDGSGGGAMPAGVKFVKSIAVSDSDGYHVHTRPNRIVIVVGVRAVSSVVTCVSLHPAPIISSPPPFSSRFGGVAPELLPPDFVLESPFSIRPELDLSLGQPDGTVAGICQR